MQLMKIIARKLYLQYDQSSCTYYHHNLSPFLSRNHSSWCTAYPRKASKFFCQPYTFYQLLASFNPLPLNVQIRFWLNSKLHKAVFSFLERIQGLTEYFIIKGRFKASLEFKVSEGTQLKPHWKRYAILTLLLEVGARCDETCIADVGKLVRIRQQILRVLVLKERVGAVLRDCQD